MPFFACGCVLLLSMSSALRRQLYTLGNLNHELRRSATAARQLCRAHDMLSRTHGGDSAFVVQLAALRDDAVAAAAASTVRSPGGEDPG